MIPTYAARLGLVACAVGACGPRADRAAPAAPPSAESRGPSTASSVILFVGTSLTAGYGLPDPSLAFPALIQRKLDSAGLRYRVVNAGVSGETSAGALRRIDWVLSQSGQVAVLVVETGANDGLRGQDPDSVQANIQAILDRAKRLAPPPRLVLAGMEAMPNLGRAYTNRFRAIYPRLARANGAALIPFLLEGVAGIDSLNQVDGMHPNRLGHQRVAENVWRVLRQVIGDRP